MVVLRVDHQGEEEYNRKWKVVDVAINRVINSYSREQTMFKITSKEYIDVTMNLQELIFLNNSGFVQRMRQNVVQFMRTLILTLDKIDKDTDITCYDQISKVLEQWRVYENFMSLLGRVMGCLFSNELFPWKRGGTLRRRCQGVFGFNMVSLNVHKLNNACVECINDIRILQKTQYIESVVEYVALLSSVDEVQSNSSLTGMFLKCLLKNTTKVYYPFLFESLKGEGFKGTLRGLRQLAERQFWLLDQLVPKSGDTFKQEFLNEVILKSLKREDITVAIAQPFQHQDNKTLHLLYILLNQFGCGPFLLPFYSSHISRQVSQVFELPSLQAVSKPLCHPFFKNQVASESLLHRLLLLHSNITNLNSTAFDSDVHICTCYFNILAEKLGSMRHLRIEASILSSINSVLLRREPNGLKVLKILISLLRLIPVNIRCFSNGLKQSMIKRLQGGTGRIDSQEYLIDVIRGEGIFSDLSLTQIKEIYKEEQERMESGSKGKSNPYWRGKKMVEVVREGVTRLKIFSESSIYAIDNHEIELPAPMVTLLNRVNEKCTSDLGIKMDELKLLHLSSQILLSYTTRNPEPSLIQLNNLQACMFYFIYQNPDPSSIRQLGSLFPHLNEQLFMGNLCNMIRNKVVIQDNRLLTINLNVSSHEMVTVDTYFNMESNTQEEDSQPLKLKAMVVRILKREKEIHEGALASLMVSSDEVDMSKISETVEELVDSGYIKRETPLLIYIP